MRQIFIGMSVAIAAALAAGAANAQTVKVGVVMSFSGQFADTGTQMGNGIKLYIKQHGDTVAGKKIELVIRIPAASRPTSPNASPRR